MTRFRLALAAALDSLSSSRSVAHTTVPATRIVP